MNFEYDDRGELVYFIVNIYELFGVEISYPGLRRVIRKAYRDSKRVTPIDTGLMRSSYTLQFMSNRRVMLFFDPNKILGKTRGGKKVTTYYPKYLVEKKATFNWMDVLMNSFFLSLLAGVREINRKHKDKDKRDKIIKTTAMLAFYKLFKDQMKETIEKGRTG